MRDSSSNRNPGLDLARNLAIFLVVVQHVAFLGGLSNDGMGAVHKLQARFIEAASQCCVDLFGLLSGYLGVATLGWNWKKFGRLWLQVWMTGLLVLAGCAVAGLVCPSVFSGRLPTSADWLTAACPLLRDEYWYFTGYLFVFLLAPLLNRYAFAAGRERIGFAAAGALFLIVCGTTVFPGGVDWLPLEKGYSAAWLVCLAVFGAALRRAEDCLRSLRATVFFGAAALLVAVTAGQRLVMASVPAIKSLFADEWTLHHYTSPTVTLTAAAVLLGCARLRPSAFGGLFGRLNAVLAPCAFGVYLLHVQPFFFQNAFKGQFAFLDHVPSALFGAAVVGTALAIYLLFAALEAVQKKLVHCRSNRDGGEKLPRFVGCGGGRGLPQL